MLNIKKFISFLLLAGLCINTLSVYSYAGENENNEIDPKILKDVLALEKNFINPSLPEHDLDPYQVTSQVAKMEHQKEDLEHLKKLIASGQNLSPGEELEDFVDLDILPTRQYSPNLKLIVKNNDEQTAKEILQKDFLESFSPLLNHSFKLEESGHFQLVDKKGKMLNHFFRDVEGLGFYGPYIVYVEKNSYNEAQGYLPLRFIDLDYFKGAIGNAALPVFTLPIKSDSKHVSSFGIKGGQLEINGTLLNGEGLKLLSSFFQVEFNISVSLADPKTHVRAEALIKELVNVFNDFLKEAGTNFDQQFKEAIDNERPLQEVLNNAGARLLFQKQVTSLVDKVKLNGNDKQEILDALKKSENYQKKLTQTNRHLILSRKLISRLQLLMTRFTHPQPLGSVTLMRAMIMLTEGILKKDVAIKEYSKKAIFNHPYFKYVKFGSYAVGAASIGALLPEPYTFHLYHVLDLGKMFSENVIGYLHNINFGANFAVLWGKSATTIYSGWSHLGQYFGENTPKFIVGLMNIVVLPFEIFAIPYVLTNSIKAYKSIKVKWPELTLESNSRLDAFKKGFIEYVDGERKKYEKALSDYELQKNKAQAEIIAKYTPEDFARKNEELAQIISKLEGTTNHFTYKENIIVGFGIWRMEIAEKLNRAAIFISKDANNLNRTSKAMTRLANYIDVGIKEVKVDGSIDTFGKALKHFCFSYASLTNNIKFLATTWNYVFLTRSFAVRPRTWYMAIMYPNFFNVAIRATPGEFHMPSKFNGGYNSTGSYLASAFLGDTFEKELLELKEVEKNVIPVEKLVYESTLASAFTALIEKVDNPKKLHELFESSSSVSWKIDRETILGGAKSNLGISSVIDSKLALLSGEEKAYFRTYFTKLFDETLREVLSNQAGKDARELKDHEIKRSLTEVKEFNLEKIKQDLPYVIKMVEKEKKVKEFAKEASTNIGMFFERGKINYHHNLFADVDPKGSQITRFTTAEKGIKNPSAVARTARFEMGSLLVSKPVALLALLILYAGVESGINKTFYPDEADGDNAYLYFSRYLFYTGIVVGTIVDIMSGSWYKIQIDSRIADSGGFDKVPLQEYRKVGFWRYYAKSLTNPTNSWIKNQAAMSKLLWSNMPAYFVLACVTEFITMGRIDMDSFIAMYLFYFFTPFEGINAKLEQGFELASTWITARIPQEYRSLPLAQQYINKEIQKKKLVYNLFEKTYDTLFHKVNELYQGIDTTIFGPRSFVRLVFNGYTPTELWAISMRKSADALSFIPGSSPFFSACEKIFTNHYTSWMKIGPK